MIKAAKDKKGRLAGHLAICDECQQAVSILRSYDLAGYLPLSSAPEGLVQKAISLPIESGRFQSAVRSIAKIVFDSWLMPQPVGVRGQGSLENRRLRFAGNKLTLDFRAERLKDGWSFIAQTSGTSDLPTMLKADNNELYPDQHGVFQWQSVKPPRRMCLRSHGQILKLPELTWRKPRKK